MSIATHNRVIRWAWSSFYQVQQKERITFDLDLNAKQKIEKAARVLPQNLSTSFRGRMCQWPGREDRITSKVMCCNFTGRTEGLPRMDWFNVLRRLISLRRHSVLPPWSICASVYPKTNFWESQSEKWTLCGLHACHPFPNFLLLWRVWSVIVSRGWEILIPLCKIYSES